MVEIPTPTFGELMWFILGILIGLPAPYWYAAERVQGFTRWMLDKIPYKSPPNMDEKEALEEVEEKSK